MGIDRAGLGLTELGGPPPKGFSGRQHWPAWSLALILVAFQAGPSRSRAATLDLFLEHRIPRHAHRAQPGSAVRAEPASYL